VRTFLAPRSAGRAAPQGALARGADPGRSGRSEPGGPAVARQAAVEARRPAAASAAMREPAPSRRAAAAGAPATKAQQPERG